LTSVADNPGRSAVGPARFPKASPESRAGILAPHEPSTSGAGCIDQPHIDGAPRLRQDGPWYGRLHNLPAAYASLVTTQVSDVCSSADTLVAPSAIMA
jgi:hypothetical protein